MRSLLLQLLFISTLFWDVIGHEKTLRKMVRDRHKMVQKPFSASGLVSHSTYNIESHMPEFDQAKISTQKYILDEPILSSGGNTKISNEKVNSRESIHIKSGLTMHSVYDIDGETNSILFNDDNIKSLNIAVGANFDTPPSQLFSNVEKVKNLDLVITVDEHFEVTPRTPFIKGSDRHKDSLGKEFLNLREKIPQNKSTLHKILHEDFYKVEKRHNIVPTSRLYHNSTITSGFDGCIQGVEADIDAQILFSNLDIEPTWIKNKTYWDKEFESRYEALMRSTKWPPLNVLLMPVAQVDTYSSVPFHLYTHNIITNVVNKLQIYKNLTFTWNEVAQFSQWWKRASRRNRKAVLRLIEEERFEITTGGWVEIEEATSYIFGMLHQLTEGHQWLKNNLNYLPEVAWLTKSVTHSPTVPYILSASGVPNLVITNIHFSIERYFAKNQYSDFVWVQNWETNRSGNNATNDLNEVRDTRYGLHSVATHYLQFNSDNFGACGPLTELCHEEFDFENLNKDIDEYNIKEKSELLLEQYSKTGTLSSHNVIIVPLGGPYPYQNLNSITKLYNNYLKIADFINLNQNIYNCTLQFGTPKDYFARISSIHKNNPTIKGEFYNFADINSGSPVYWTAFFRTRPGLKLLLRYLESNLRSAEILFTFAHSFNVFETFDTRDLFKRLIEVRDSTACFQDPNIIRGKLSADLLQYINKQILKTIKDCWHLQEAAASLLSTKLGTNKIYIGKYVYRDGNFISPYKSIVAGDQLYIFNSLSQERVEVVEFITRFSNLKIKDHNNKDVELQINPIFQYTSEHVIISRQFYKIIFIVTLPPFTFKLFKIEPSQDTTSSMSTIYCDKCEVETITSNFPSFKLHSIEKGDIEIENDRHHVIIDQDTGFIKIVTDKTTGQRKEMFVDYGAITSSHKNIQFYTFNVKSKNNKVTIIIAGHITTEVTSIFENVLHHSTKIFHVSNGPLRHVLKMESQLGYELSAELKETEVFLSIQTDIKNGKNPEIVVDNNGFQYTAHFVNLSRNIESNMYSVTSLAFIQDKKNRLTIITDHTQGVTSVNEGQIMIMLAKISLDKDDSANKMDIEPMTHSHILLLESFVDTEISANSIQFPSTHAIYLANVMNYPLDVFFIDHNATHLCHYAFLPLLKNSFPCGVNMINYRMLADKKYNEHQIQNTALLTLQRSRYYCNTQLKSINNIECKGDSQFNLLQIFHNICKVYKTNLVGTDQGAQTDSFDLSNFKPLELMTLKVHFEM